MSVSEQVANVKGVPVYMIEIPLDERVLNFHEQGGRGVRCPLCLTGWQDRVPTTAPLLISNNRIFPNCTVHQECIDAAGGWQQAAEHLGEEYSAYKELRKKYKTMGWWQER